MPAYLRSRLESNREKNATPGGCIGGIARRLLRPQDYPALLRSMAGSTITRVRSVSGGNNEGPPLNYLKRRYEALEDSFITGKEWRLYKRQARSYKAELVRRYETLCEPPALDQPYLYFPLHYQPERTTSPESGRFSNQELVVKMIAHQLPPGWRIIVKENPTQLLSHTAHGERGRLPYYYDDLLSTGRVSLVPIGTSQFDLIDNAMAVAALTGTTGFEAVLRGKPVLIFGCAWYRGCDGTFTVRSNNDLATAIARILEGARPEIRNVLLFMLALDRAGIRGFVNPKRARPDEETFARNVDNLKRLVLEHVRLSK